MPIIPQLPTELKGQVSGMKMHRFACWSLGIVFVVVGLAHFASVENFSKMIPDALPYKSLAVILTGILELILAAGLIFPATRIWSGRAIFLVLILYTPLHVIDLMRETPVIGPKVVAIIRLPIQGVMLYLAWLIGWPRK